MSDAWYFHDGQQQHGALTLQGLVAALNTRPLPEKTLVWRAGFANWKQAEDIPEVADQLQPAAAQPPPLPTNPVTDPPNRIAPPASVDQSDIESAIVPGPHRSNNFIAMGWRGEFPLWVTYWIFNFLGGLVVVAIATGAEKLLSVDKGFQPRNIFILMTIVWLVMLAVSIWQMVAVWRSAGRHIRERNRAGKRAPWAVLAKVAVVLGSLRLLAELANSGLPSISETFRIAFLDDPGTPAYTIRVMRNGTEAEITGGFKYGLTDDFVKILGASPRIKVLHLNSEGGRIGEAQRLNAVIRQHRLVTYVSFECLSACTVAYAGGRQRWVHRRAKLGFHRAAFPGLSETEMASGTRDAYRNAGFDDSFITRVLATPHDEMWVPSLDELLRVRVVTAISEGDDFAASGFGENVTRERVAAYLAKLLPALRPLKLRLPEAYEAVVDAYYDSYLEGRTEGEMNAAVRGKFHPILDTYRAWADDDVVVAYAALHAEKAEALGAKDATVCYTLALARGYEDQVRGLPASLIKREHALYERIIATASRRPSVTRKVTGPLWERVEKGLAAKGFGADMFDLLQHPSLPASQHAAYCRFLVAYLREITSLQESEAALLLREHWTTK